MNHDPAYWPETARRYAAERDALAAAATSVLALVDAEGFVHVNAAPMAALRAALEAVLGHPVPRAEPE